MGAPQHGANIMGAIGDSFRLLSMQHGARIILQEKTRRELGGPFVKDYHNSLRVPRSWGDGDGWLMNYVGHPWQGATSGWVWIHNDAGAEEVKLSRSRKYWTSRARALAERREQHPVRDWPLQRGLDSQRRAETGDGGLDGLHRDPAGRRRDHHRRGRHRRARPDQARTQDQQSSLARRVSVLAHAQPRDGQPCQRPVAVASRDTWPRRAVVAAAALRQGRQGEGHDGVRDPRRENSPPPPAAITTY